MITTRLARDKATLIAEVWYLDREWIGAINKVLGPCGVSYYREYPPAESIVRALCNHDCCQSEIMPLGQSCVNNTLKKQLAVAPQM